MFLKELILIKQMHQNTFSFKFQPYVCNRYHDVLMMSVNLNDIAI